MGEPQISIGVIGEPQQPRPEAEPLKLELRDGLWLPTEHVKTGDMIGVGNQVAKAIPQHGLQASHVIPCHGQQNLDVQSTNPIPPQPELR